ncbi:MAG: tripartite tricarboxylate transporter substrate binding protein [Burkholderiales bacterium]|nr:tripartite tricarboxylate transporter substrate binding protein [Burkholderiales bacterium]
MAHAQGGYPVKPIRYVVPYPPGGPLDIVARLTGQRLSARLGQPVIVDNRPGAGGNIGADMVAKAPPDGYTVVMGAVATHAINPHLYRKLPYDPVRDFAPVTLITQVPNILVVHPALPVKSVNDLIALAKAKPGALNFGSGSTGSAGHLAGELFKVMAKVDMVHVPYKGAAPAVADLLGGQIQLMFDNLASALPNVKAGKLRAVALTTSRRAAQVPDLPTIAESGLPGFDLSTWFGIFAPAKTPGAIVAKLHAELSAILASAEIKAQLANLGAEPATLTPAEFERFVKSELAKYERIVQASGAKVD